MKNYILKSPSGGFRGLCNIMWIIIRLIAIEMAGNISLTTSTIYGERCPSGG